MKKLRSAKRCPMCEGIGGVKREFRLMKGNLYIPYLKGYVDIQYLPLATKWNGVYAIVFHFLGKKKGQEYILDRRVPVYLCENDLPVGSPKVKNHKIVGDLKIK